MCPGSILHDEGTDGVGHASVEGFTVGGFGVSEGVCGVGCADGGDDCAWIFMFGEEGKQRGAICLFVYLSQLLMFFATSTSFFMFFYELIYSLPFSRPFYMHLSLQCCRSF